MSEYTCGKCGTEYKLGDGAYRTTAFIVCPECHPEFEAEYQEVIQVLENRKQEGDWVAENNLRDLVNTINGRQYVNPNDYL